MEKTTTCGHGPYHAKSMCKPCYHADYYQRNRDKALAQVKAWRDANPGRAQANNRARRTANPEAAREYHRAYHEAHAIQRRARVREWREANPDRVRENSRLATQRRRARKFAAGEITEAEWRAILAEFDHRCAYCNVGDVPMEMEHMTPLARGGRHDKTNIVPACAPCNREKHTKTAFEFVGPRRINAEAR